MLFSHCGLNTHRSHCNLTKEEDKLITISGIAKRIMRLIPSKDEYVAGLWRRVLPSQLLWDVDWVDHPAPSRHNTYCVPSWSWASIKGSGTMMDPTDDGILIRILDVRTTTVTDDATGQLSGGYIHLVGPPLIPVRITRPPQTKERLFGLIEFEATLNGLKLEPGCFVEPDVRDDSKSLNGPFYFLFVCDETPQKVFIGLIM
jgi:hypothetical protein